MKKVFALLLTFAFVCSLRGQSSDPEMNLTIRQIVEKYYVKRGFVMGCSSKKSYLTEKNAAQLDFFVKEWNYNTPENDFKQDKVYTHTGANWFDADYRPFIEIARKNKQVIRAHCPVGQQCSKWTKEDERTAAELEEVLSTFVTQMSRDLQANKDVVKWMDVVNETFSNSDMRKGRGYDGAQKENVVSYPKGGWMGPVKGIEQTENPWTIIGMEQATVDGVTFEIPKYIRRSFELADKNAPAVKLIYNEHGAEMYREKFERLKQVVKFLRSQKVRIDGLGWQAHIDLGWEKKTENIALLNEVIDWCYKNKLEFHITELDVTVSKGKKSKDSERLEATRQEQADTFGAIVETILKRAGKGATALNYWTMHDHFIRGVTFACLFDWQGNPQPAYYRVKELLLKYKK